MSDERITDDDVRRIMAESAKPSARGIRKAKAEIITLGSNLLSARADLTEARTENERLKELLHELKHDYGEGSALRDTIDAALTPSKPEMK